METTITDENIKTLVDRFLKNEISKLPLDLKKKPIGDWDVSKVTNMKELFANYANFNGDLSRWDVSNVKDMTGMFSGCRAFNGDLSRWNVSNVEDMTLMFAVCINFNGDLSKWKIKYVKNMTGMFSNCAIFNGDLSQWDVTFVENMKNMFLYCAKFNGDLSKWNVLTVDDMSSMFFNCAKFNSDLSQWDVSNVQDMTNMFFYCDVFNSDLSKWDVSNVFNMAGMFKKCKVFNSDLSRWDVMYVKNMSEMFLGCTKFNGDLSKWDVSNSTNMFNMFLDCPIEAKHKPEFYVLLHKDWSVENSATPETLEKMVEPEKKGKVIKPEVVKEGYVEPERLNSDGTIRPARTIPKRIISKAEFEILPAVYGNTHPRDVYLKDLGFDAVENANKPLEDFFEDSPQGFVFRVVSGKRYIDFLLSALPSDITDYILYNCLKKGYMNPSYINQKHPLVDLGKIIGADSGLRVFIEKKHYDERVIKDTRAHKIYILYKGKKNKYKSLAAYSAIHGDKDLLGIRDIHNITYVGNLHCNEGGDMSGYLWNIKPMELKTPKPLTLSASPKLSTSPQLSTSPSASPKQHPPVKLPRCKNGTRRNRRTKKCEPYSKVAATTTGGGGSKKMKKRTNKKKKQRTMRKNRKRRN